MDTLKISIMPEDIKPAVLALTDSEQCIDVFMLGHDLWTSLDMWENNLEWEWENVQYPLKEYDYEAGYIDYLNHYPIEIVRLVNPELYNSQELQAGAYLALQYPDIFATELTKWQERIEEGYNDDDTSIVPADLLQEKRDAEDSYHKELNHLWLYGDRSEQGGLDKIRRELRACEIDYNQKTDTVSLEYEPQEAAELVEQVEEHGEDVTVNFRVTPPTEAELKAYIVSTIESNAVHQNNKNKADREERRAESERVAAYKAEQAKKAEAERKAKLLAMKKL